MHVYTKEEIDALLAPLHDLEIEPVRIQGEEIPNLYRGVARMNKERTAGIYLVSADDMEHDENVNIDMSVVKLIMIGPDVIRYLLYENNELRRQRDRAIEAADEFANHQH